MDPQEKFRILFNCFCLFILAIFIIIKILPRTLEQGKENVKKHLEHQEEIEKALQEARKIKRFFEDVVKNRGGYLNITLCRLEDTDEIDYERETHSPFIYFRVVLDNGYNQNYRDALDNYRISETERIELENQYLWYAYGKGMKEIKELGIRTDTLIYMLEKGDSYGESILYYQFDCPEKGAARHKFIDKI